MAIKTATRTVNVTQQQADTAAPPPMYQVVLLNDDFTPMDFVVMILQEVFGKNMPEATYIMLKVHNEGRGICGIYTRDIAATKVDTVIRTAQRYQHPLQCVMEPAPD